MPPPPASLADFVAAAAARGLYRDFCRALRSAPPSVRADAAAAVKAGFQASAGARGGAARHALADGRAQLKRVREMIDMTST